MKCNNCGSEWNAKNTLNEIAACPFCGMPITQEKNTVKAALKWIVEEKGFSVLQNGSLINSMLADLAKDEEKERNRMRLALSSGAGTLFFKLYTRSNGIFRDVEINEFRMNLEEYGFAEDFSLFVLDTFLYAVGLPSKKVIEPKKNDETVNQSEPQSKKSLNNVDQRHQYNDDNPFYAVELAAVGYDKIKTIKLIREIGFGLKEAKDFVDNAPTILAENLTYQDAEKIKQHIEQYGSKVNIKKTTILFTANKVQSTEKMLDCDLKFMMKIEDSFTISGRGTVVVGKVLIGTFNVGNAVDIVLSNGHTISTTITGIEMFRKSLDQAQAGDNVGVFLCGIKKDDIINAQVLVNANAIALHKIFTA